MSEYLEVLNDIQRQAVEQTEGPVMVIAGPGSGKTRVLTYRVAHLIKVGVAPWNILALTFTNKAAREMKARIETLVGPTARDIWAGTFHSIFARILRVEAAAIGFPTNFTIYDTDDAKSLLNEIIKEMGLDKNMYKPAGVLARISSAKSNLIVPSLYVKDKDLLEQDRMSRRPRLHEIYKAYMERCVRAGAMDFDDLLLRLYQLFRQHPEVLKKYQQRFQYVMVDEFQDTNYLQYAIVKMLVKYPGSKENVGIVGDDAQSIYSFRGATIANILDFETDFPDTRVFKLEQNYRSTNPIVGAANEVIANNRRQIPKKIWTDKEGGTKIKLIKAISDTEEGRMVANLIIEQKTRHHVSNKEIAILYRTNAQSRVFEEHLRRNNIAYRIFGGLSFYQRKEVKDLLAYLRLAVNPKDHEAFKRIINFPKRGIGATTVQKILDFASQYEVSAMEALGQLPIKGKAATLLDNFQKMIGMFMQKAAKEDAYTAAAFIYFNSGLQALMKSDNTIEGINRMENVNALLDGIKEFVENDEEGASEERTLAAYIQNIALLTDMDVDQQEQDYVTLMSVHSAKGLEYGSVFVVGLEENLFPSFMSMNSPEQLDEERRLFYVAITRAEKFLTLSYANSRYQYGQIRYNDPSRFVEEIPEELFEATAGRNFPQQEARSSLSGIPKRKQTFSSPVKVPKDFKPSPSYMIEEGKEVLHLKFGKGTVLKIDGGEMNKVATIRFEGIDNPERRLMLRFAKLQVIS
jgi:DNA helicase-2/ATP-dependent DNA helicase PcrA